MARGTARLARWLLLAWAGVLQPAQGSAEQLPQPGAAPLVQVVHAGRLSSAEAYPN